MNRAKLKVAEPFEITNQQRIKRINIKNIHKVLKSIFFLLDMPQARVSVLLCDNKFIRKLNRKFFGKTSVTDVISFPLKDKIYPQYLGEVIICVEEAVKAAGQYANIWQEEFTLYIINGILHTLGYNDISKKERIVMQNKQEKILSKILEKHKKIVDNIGE